MTMLTRCFSGSYAEARHKFTEAAGRLGLPVESHVREGLRGAYGEVLATDVVRIEAAPATPGNGTRAGSLVVISSGTHGVEGFCGSGCQVALLHDTDLLRRASQAGVTLLLIHAVNPYGFSHLRRVNEDNVDVNRNSVDFNAALPANPAYRELDPIMLPAQWPPPADNAGKIGQYIAQHGMLKFREGVIKGQYDVADGLFYGGAAPVWSTRTTRSIVRKHGAGFARIAWIDLHTGLGPYGHGEKLYAGKPSQADLDRSRGMWGTDVFAMFQGDAVSVDTDGPISKTLYQECPDAQANVMGLEFGTVPEDAVLNALRAEHWLHRHPDAPAALRADIKAGLRDAFFCDNDEWKGMILAQSRVATLQAIQGLRVPAAPH